MMIKTPFSHRKRISLAGLTLLAGAFTAAPAFAHGTMSNPTSRIYRCFQEGPENPQSAACKAAVKVGDSWPLYDWDEVNIGNADGHSRQIIPDGKLCSAGRAKYKGLDLPRADWPATTMPGSGRYNFQYVETAAHQGTFELYVTKNGYDPTKPLKWSDLEDTPFYKQDNPPIVGGAYQLNATLPGGRTGRHLIYSIWQRHWPDSGEAFYSCSDVIFTSSNRAEPFSDIFGKVGDWYGNDMILADGAWKASEYVYKSGTPDAVLRYFL